MSADELTEARLQGDHERAVNEVFRRLGETVAGLDDKSGASRTVIFNAALRLAAVAYLKCSTGAEQLPSELIEEYTSVTKTAMDGLDRLRRLQADRAKERRAEKH